MVAATTKSCEKREDMLDISECIGKQDSGPWPKAGGSSAVVEYQKACESKSQSRSSGGMCEMKTC
jgi:hypothetical protein